MAPLEKKKEMVASLLLGFILASTVCFCVSGKECTNSPTQISSHTIRAQLMSSKNETWKTEIISQFHLDATDESSWMDLHPRKLLYKEPLREEFDWAMFFNTNGLAGTNGQIHGGDFLREVSLHDVRLDPNSMYERAQQTNLEYLLILDVDRDWFRAFASRLAYQLRGNLMGAGSPRIKLRGHFVGHYTSASALMWASTHNLTLREKMSSVVIALYACQNKTGTGYLSAFPPEFFDRFEAIKRVWAPYYTIHKQMNTLINVNPMLYLTTSQDSEYREKRRGNFLKLVGRSTSESEAIPGDQKHLILAHLFDKPCFLGLLAVKADSLSGFHANTHIPVVIGAQMRYEITGDPLYKEIGTFFMDIVYSSHSYATGGTSVSEFWSDPRRLADNLSTEDQESCTTYNMLKVSRTLFRWTKEMAYADYYERALTNGVLSIQRGTEPGVMIYMLPQGPGQSKARSYHGWGTKFNDFWCCYGTGIESFSKLGDSIYFEEMGITPGLYITQFIPSFFNWKSVGITLTQKIEPIHSWQPYLQVSLTVHTYQSSSRSSTLKVRIPFWTSLNGAKATINAQDLSLPSPGSFLSITRRWTWDDTLTLELPIGLRTEAIKDERPEYASIQAIVFGPFLLAGLTTKDWNINARNSTAITDWITSIPASSRSQLVSLSQRSNHHVLFLSNSNYSLTMNRQPKDGTNGAVHATFRLVPRGPMLSRAQLVMLEAFDLPGMAVVHQGPNNGLKVSGHGVVHSVFRLVPSLNGDDNSVSFESEDQRGCFVCADGTNVKLMCEDCVSEFGEKASFRKTKGLRDYDPISFVAKGTKRNFLLEPLLSLRDENYTVYFNIGT